MMQASNDRGDRCKRQRIYSQTFCCSRCALKSINSDIILLSRYWSIHRSGHSFSHFS